MRPRELGISDTHTCVRFVQLGSFGWTKDIAFPIWLGFMVLCFLCLESRKQYRRYFAKGAANVCGFMEVINEDHALTHDKALARLVPRTEELPIYTMAEFNDKVTGRWRGVISKTLPKKKRKRGVLYTTQRFTLNFLQAPSSLT